MAKLGSQILNKSYDAADSYNIVFSTYNKYFTCFEAVNLVQKLTVHTVNSKWSDYMEVQLTTQNKYITMTQSCEVMFSRTN